MVVSNEIKRIVWRKYTLGRIWNGVEPVVRMISVGWWHFRAENFHQRRKKWLEARR